MDLLNRLEEKTAATTVASAAPITAFDRPKLIKLKDEPMSLTELAPQARSYAFESFLKNLFDVYGLTAQEPFRLRGEQIDGSSQLSSETYLVEAKWKALLWRLCLIDLNFAFFINKKNSKKNEHPPLSR